MNNPKISVIVPIYNVEMFLDECIQSILNQNYANFELILVDDGSLDSSTDIAKRIASENPEKCEYFSKQNGGLSDARNFGIQRASGEYIMFIDSDDFISHNTLTNVVKELENEEIDIVCFGVNEITESGEFIRSIPANSLFSSGTFSSKSNHLLMTKSLPNAWNKVYKRSLFIDNDVSFPIGLWYEDLGTIPKLFYFANKIKFIGNTLYSYRQREGAITKTYSLKVLDIFKILDVLSEFFAKNPSSTARSDLNTWYVNAAIITMARLSCYSESQKDKKDAIKEISDLLRRQFPSALEVIFNNTSKLRYRVFAFFIRIGFERPIFRVISSLVNAKLISP